MTVLPAAWHELPVSALVDGQPSPLIRIAGEVSQRWERSGQPFCLGLGKRSTPAAFSVLASGGTWNAPCLTFARRCG